MTTRVIPLGVPSLTCLKTLSARIVPFDTKKIFLRMTTKSVCRFLILRFKIKKPEPEMRPC